MGQFVFFFRLELKRMFRLFPQICIVTLLFLCAAFLFLRGYTADGEEEEKRKLMIGVTAQEEDLQIVELGVSLLESMDSTKYSVQFELLTEAEGQAKIEEGVLDAWIIMPENYVSDVYYGVEEPIVVRFGSSQSGVSALLVRQLADTVSELMMDSRAGVYAMQDMYTDWGLAYTSDADRLSQGYLLKILGREKFLQQETVSATDNLATDVYYFCVGLLMLFLLWGLNCGSILGQENALLGQMMERQGLSAQKQAGAKLLSLLVLFLLNFFVAAAVIVLALTAGNIHLTQLEEYTAFDWIGIFVKQSAVFPMICAIALLVYEKTKDAVGGSLFFFFLIIALSFLSGCFYPLSFFPMWMQRLAEFLPTRVLLKYIAGCVSGSGNGSEFLHLLIYTGILILLAAVNTKNRFSLKRGAR